MNDLVENPPITEQELASHANEYNNCASKFYVTTHEFRLVNDTIKKRAFHTDAQKITVLEQGMGKTAKLPITFLKVIKALTVTGRANRTLTQAQFTLLRDEFETFCERVPEGITPENWQKQIEEFCWQVIYEKGKDKVGDRMVGNVATTYQDRLAAMFNGEFLPRMRIKVDTFTSTSACIGMMLPAGLTNMPTAGYGPTRRSSQASVETPSPYGEGFIGGIGGPGPATPQNPMQGQGGGGQRPQLPKVCWHYLKSTPCSKVTVMGQSGILWCEHGMHPGKGQLDAATFAAIKKSRYGKQNLKKVAFESWLCTPVPAVNLQQPPMQFGWGMNSGPAHPQQPQFQMGQQFQSPIVQQQTQQQVPQMQMNPNGNMFQQMMNFLQQQQPRPQ
eukprot:g19065.t1